MNTNIKLVGSKLLKTQAWHLFPVDPFGQKHPKTPLLILLSRAVWVRKIRIRKLGSRQASPSIAKPWGPNIDRRIFVILWDSWESRHTQHDGWPYKVFSNHIKVLQKILASGASGGITSGKTKTSKASARSRNLLVAPNWVSQDMLRCIKWMKDVERCWKSQHPKPAVYSTTLHHLWCDEKQNGLMGMSRDEGQPPHLIGLLCAALKMRLNG